MDFNSQRYGGGGLHDVTDAYGNNGFYNSFHHLISQKNLKFKAYLSSFNESYTSDYAAEPVFGRSDPIYAFRSTTRSIALSFKAVASSIQEGYENLAKVQVLSQFLYPAYTEDNSATTISQAPLIRLKMMNFVNDAKQLTPPSTTGNEGDIRASTVYSSYKVSTEPKDGLLGVITSMTVMHNLESDAGVFEKTDGTVIPKHIEVTISFSPIHEHTLGWNENKEFYENSFPYGTALAREGAEAGDPPPEESVQVSDAQAADNDVAAENAITDPAAYAALPPLSEQISLSEQIETGGGNPYNVTGIDTYISNYQTINRSSN